jgi:mannan endo-1,4-beta-mannosidase
MRDTRRMVATRACLSLALVVGCNSTEVPAGGNTGGSTGQVGGAATGGVTVQGGVGTGGGATGGSATGGALGTGGVATGGMAGAAGGSDLRPKTFVKRSGTQFDDGGKRHVFVGTNFWQGMNLATNDSTGDPPRMLRELDRMQAIGITNVRVMASSEGPDGQPYRMNPALMQSPGQYNDSVFRGLDALLDALAARGMRAVMVLNNYWQWSGGMGQYVSWSDGSQIPYPVGSTTYQTFETYVARFYSCTTCQTNYRNHIQTVINRRNTVNGLVYRDDPTIFAWELANEPRRYPSNWINDIASYIKSLDSNHMVTTGSEGTNGGINFQTSHQSSYIDYGTCHIWAENTNHYDPNNSTTTSLNGAITYALNYLSEHESTMRGLGKPLVLEEMGLARDGWTGSGKFDPNATTTHRDQYFQTVFNTVESDMNSGQSLWGDGFWAWAGEARPSGTWTGDPPHETAGWYSVYDKDASTVSIITNHAKNVAAFGR